MNVKDNIINNTDQAIGKYISSDSDLHLGGFPLLIQVKNKELDVISNTANHVTARAKYLTDINNVHDETKQTDHLFECVTELQNNPDSLLTAGSTKFIKIESGGKKITLKTQAVKLPSGRRIYVGYYKRHRVVSHGDVYHLSDVIKAENQTVVNSVCQLLAQIVGASSYFLKALSNRPISNNTVSQANAGYNADARMATADEYSQYSLSLNNYPPYFNTRAKRSVTGLPELGRQSNVNPEIADPKKITFNLVTETIVLSVPNKLGLRIMNELFEELKSTRPDTTNDLSSLIAFDEFAAAKVVDIFSEGLFLKQHSKAADMILIKRRIEVALNDHRKKETTLTISKLIIQEHYSSQLRVAHFLSGLLGRLGTMIYKLDLDLIGAFVDYKNKLSYDETILKLNEDLKLAIEENQIILHQFHKLLAIMNSAHNNFREQLLHDVTGAVFEKILYISDWEIYESLLNDKKDVLNEMLIKRLFYYIFEYTRIHGISIYSNFLIIPQDLTNNWRIFENNEKEIEENNISEVFNEEMINFISSKEKDHSHIDKILKLSQLVLDEKITNSNETLQYESGFVLADEVKEILEHRMNRFNSEPNQLNYESQWRRAFSSELHHDQECYIMVNYIINLQLLASDIIDEMWRANLKIKGVTAEQLIAEAKINAVRLIDKQNSNEADDDSLLYEYKRRVENGDVKLFLKAAIYWYFSERTHASFVEKRMVFTYIIKQFREQELLNAVMFKQRTLESYTHVSQMRHSNEKENLEDYYNQFVEYKYHDMYHEARDLTMKLLNHSSLSYLEIIRTPKEIYTFRIKSRNYVQNTLATQAWVSDPIENIGYISLVQTYCDKFYFISTVSSVDYIVKHQRVFDNVFIQHLIKVWKDNDTKNGHPLSVKISSTQQELLSLYFKENITDEKSDFLINMVLKAPESNRNSNPLPEYELWTSPEVDINLPLIDYLDSLNEKTLTEICNILKVNLLEDTWIDKIGRYIPFFSVLWQHWHDSEHNIEFKDVIFDLFDTLMVILNSAITLRKLTINAFVDALKLAKIKNIPKKNIKMFIARQIFISSPSIGFKSAKNVMLECSSLVNPIPLSHIILPKMTKIFSKGVSQSIELTNKILKKRKEKNIDSRSEWISNVDHSLISPDFGNLYSQKLDNDKKNYYITIDNDYYKVQWLDDKLSWCIVKPHSVGGDTECIPITSNEAGKWIAKSESFEKHYASIFDMDTSPVNKDIGLAAISFEPMQQLELTFDKLSQEEMTFRRRLNFFIINKQDVLEKLHAVHTPTARIISHLHSYLTDENAMIKQALAYKNSYNKPLFISDVAKISHDFQKKSFSERSNSGETSMMLSLLHI
ncbi:hypothetical protein [Biostraticola tofi]|uniref:Uncharacterized protein n=1 Tax=Biostraticola tofi TaxID=466109 RepID=A0A4R3YIG9_9GAMM|nr:hypothetical protein [Biostraticola tofi]TCV91901.1 hypothetical protein EDC52_1146 [Biostraticola tofi]